jgi:DNA-directed RNA polymerase specialized sigma24 family protein
LTDPEIDVLVVALRKTPDDSKIKDQLILAFVNMASAMAFRYSKLTGMNSDDLQGEAILGVIAAVNRFHAVEHDNIGGYINKYIKRYCTRFIKKNALGQPLAEDQLYSKESIIGDIIVNEIIEKISNSLIERRVINMRCEGYSDTEIGKELGVKRQYVWTIRRNLFNRYRRILNEC